MLRLEVIQEWIFVQDYMIFIMEEDRMWQVQKKKLLIFGQVIYAL